MITSGPLGPRSTLHTHKHTQPEGRETLAQSSQEASQVKLFSSMINHPKQFCVNMS